MRDTPGSQGIVLAVQFQLPWSDLVFRPGMLVEVTACELRPSMVGWTGVLSGVTDAPNAIERTLLAEIDTADTD